MKRQSHSSLPSESFDLICRSVRQRSISISTKTPSFRQSPIPEKPSGKTTWHSSGEFMRYHRWGRNPNKDPEFALDVRRHYAACVSYARFSSGANPIGIEFIAGRREYGGDLVGRPWLALGRACDLGKARLVRGIAPLSTRDFLPWNSSPWCHDRCDRGNS